MTSRPLTDGTGQIMKRDQATATIENFFKANATAFKRLMPMNSEEEGKRFLRIAFTEISKSPKLMQCTPQSLFGAVAQAATLGLEIGNALGHGYLVPYGNVATFLPGYKGLVDLTYRSGMVSTVQSMAVREGEPFEWNPMAEPPIKHRPQGDPAAALVWVYTRIKMTSGDVTYLAMSLKEVEAVRVRSRAKNEGPWVTDYEAMAMKTCLRRHLKLMPTSPMVQRAIAADERVDAGLAGDFDLDLNFDELPQDPRGQESVEAPVPPVNVNTVTGEITEPGEESQVEVRAEPMGNCPQHVVAWMRGENGGLYHYNEGQTCSPAKVLLEAAERINWLKPDLDKWLKKNYEGRTSSKLTGAETLGAYTGLVNAPRQGQTQEESTVGSRAEAGVQQPLA